ncbi:hypothetical protein J7I96_26325 [Bacillus sp. ISL-78]|nr:hypothetical protein [Bacillus sp. ISL-78]MBT2627846.1 hypothetical protein [Bacillus sp. ISL-101]
MLGLTITFLLAFLVSSNRKQIKYKPIAIMLVLQLILSYFLLSKFIGFILIKGGSDVFGTLLNYAESGVNFVFGGIANKGEFPFFLSALLPIVFISILIGILQHLRILPFIIKGIGFLLSKVNGLGKLESYLISINIIT